MNINLILLQFKYIGTVQENIFLLIQNLEAVELVEIVELVESVELGKNESLGVPINQFNYFNKFNQFTSSTSLSTTNFPLGLVFILNSQALCFIFIAEYKLEDHEPD